MNLSLIDKIETLKSYALNPCTETVEIHVNLNINPKLADQMFVHKFALPHNIGRKVTILAFTPDLSRKAELIEAGADYVADEGIIDMIKKGKIFFDYCVASPDSMKLISPLASILGPKGLMPNIKLGTLDTNIKEAIRKLKQGQLSVKNDKYGILHVAVGKCDQSAKAIQENVESFLNFVASKKPHTVKGIYIKNIHISTTHGASVLI